MKAFITGGGGCVGRAVVRSFLNNGWDVTVLAHPNEVASLPFAVNENIKIVVGDLNAFSANDIPLESHIIHLAAKAHTVPKSEREISDFFHVNRDGTARIAQNALRQGAKAFIFVSTSGVYGETCFQEGCSENDTPKPHSAYAQSKYEAEQQLRRIWPDALPLIIFRPAVMFGPGDRGNFVKFFKVVKNGVLPIIRQGSTRKSILYVQDLARTIEFAASYPEYFHDQVFNIAYGKPYSIQELILGISQITEQKIRLIPIPDFLLLPPAILGNILGAFFQCEMPFSSRKMKVLRQNAILNTEKLMKVIEPHFSLFSFEDGLRDYIRSGKSPWKTSID